MYVFASNETKDFLASSSKRVIFYGSYDDPNNFGDIVQLKGALRLYPQHTPVIVLSYRAYKEPGYLRHLKQWFDAKHFIFIADQPRPKEYSNELTVIKKPKRGGLLHVYGGGFLNGMWGEWKLQQITGLLDMFTPETYIISGQQIDEAVVPKLKSLFKKYPPALVGLRDRQSQAYLKPLEKTVNIRYSFDDVTEIFQRWTGQQNTLKSKLTSRFRNDHYALHLNMAGYTGDTTHHQDIKDAIRQAHERYGSYTPTMLHSYNERRLEFTKDSLGVLIELQEDFPYHNYDVVNLAQMSLDLSPARNYYPDVRGLLTNVRFGITCSYHTSILLSFLGKPTYLIASNDYYRQKRKGLGYPEDLTAYLADPTKYIRDFSDDIQARGEWLKEFDQYIGS